MRTIMDNTTDIANCPKCGQDHAGLVVYNAGGADFVFWPNTHQLVKIESNEENQGDNRADSG